MEELCSQSTGTLRRIVMRKANFATAVLSIITLHSFGALSALASTPRIVTPGEGAQVDKALVPLPVGGVVEDPLNGPEITFKVRIVSKDANGKPTNNVISTTPNVTEAPPSKSRRWELGRVEH